MALFESYERRIKQINEALNSYGIASIEEAEKITKDAGLEDLGKGLRSQVGTMYGTLQKGPRYLEMAEGYVTGIALDAEDQIIGYQFVSLGKMTDFIKKGDDPNTAWEKAKGQYGRVADAVKIIDPRKE